MVNFLLIDFVTSVISLIKSIHCYILSLIFMLFTGSATSQVVADFTTLNSNSGCGSLVVDFQDLSTGSPDTWIWDFGNGIVSSVQNPSIVYSVPGVYTVKLTVGNSLSNDIKIMNDLIYVYETPNANFNQNVTEICVPSQVSFLDASITNSNLVNWMWDFGDGGSSNDQHPDYEYSYPGIYTVTLLVEDINGCENLFVYNNLINAIDMPVSSFSSVSNFSCDSPVVVQFLNQSVNSVNYYWDFGDGSTSIHHNPDHLYLSGSYSVQLVSENGICLDTFFVDDFVNIGVEIIPEFIADNLSICEGGLVSFNDVTNHLVDSWVWDFGDGSTSYLQNPSHVYSDSGFHTVKLTTSVNGSCVETMEMVNYIEVFGSPLVEFTTDTLIYCSVPASVSLFDGTLDAVSWRWTFENGDTSILSDPVIDFFVPGEYDVQLEVTDVNGCKSNINKDKYIKIDELIPDFFVLDSIVCRSDTIIFIDSSTSFYPITYYNWDFGDGDTSQSQNPSHSYDIVSSFDISLNIENSIGCVVDMNKTSFIQTVGPPSVDFVSDRFIACAGQNIYFTDLTTSPDIVSNWEWDFGDETTSNLQNPAHQYNQIGYYNVKLISGRGNCIDSLTLDDYIEIVEPSAFFEPEFNCNDPFKVEFFNLSEGADSVLWDFDDGNISTIHDPVHTFPSRGIYDVTLSVFNRTTGCSHEYVKRVRITKPEANFTYLVNVNNSLEDSVVCAPKKVYLDNLSVDCSYYKVKWEDGYVGHGRVDHLFTQLGIWDVTMIVTDIHRCKDTMTVSNMYRVTDIISDFDAVIDSYCDSLIVMFEDLSSRPSDVLWLFGEGSSSSINNVDHIYHQEGSYDVTMFSTSIDGCKDTLTKRNYIDFSIPKVYSHVDNNKICLDQKVVFQDSSSGLGLTYLWDFGDGNISMNKNTDHIYISPGSFPVYINVTDQFGCSYNNYIDTVFVKDPDIDFSGSLLSSYCPPLITTFSIIDTTDIVNYLWDFGDGSISFQKDPSHIYTQAGEYDVSLIVEDNFSCRDTLVMIDYISLLGSGPSGTFSFSENKICSYDSIEFTSITQNVDSYIWFFGDGTSSVDVNPIHLYSEPDYYHPSLVIVDTNSCEVIIHSLDSIKVISVIIDAGSDTSLCLGDSITLELYANHGQSSWSYNPYIYDTISQIAYINPDTSMFFHVSNSNENCFSTDSVYVIVHLDVPVPSFVNINNCLQDSMLILGESGLIGNQFDYSWSLLDSEIFSKDFHYQFDSSGQYDISLNVINQYNNCSAKIDSVIDVFDLPRVDFTANEVCFGDETYFTNLASDSIDDVKWYFGDQSQVSNEYDPKYLFSSHGKFTTILEVISHHGCVNSISKDVVVHEVPEIELVISNSCFGNENIFTSNVILDDGYISQWNWNFGDGNNLSSGSHVGYTYDNYGEFYVILDVVSDFGCSNKKIDTAIVYENPIVNFSAENICIGDLSQFTDQSEINQSQISKYLWHFGDDSFSDLKNPIHEFTLSGKYLVSLLVTSKENCSSYLDKDIIIYDLPLVDFAIEDYLCEDEYILFSDKTISQLNIESWEWDFGDHTNSDSKNPKNRYKHPGKYNVSLNVVSQFGCRDYLDKDIYIHETPKSIFDMSGNKVSIINPEITFNNLSDKDLYFEWDFDNGVTNNHLNIIKTHFDNIGVYDISLYVENEAGCYDVSSHSIEVTEEFYIYVPNTFTPNADGLNDCFQIKTNGVNSLIFYVYNRWGELVYHTEDITFCWDATYIDKIGLIPSGTYFYNITVQDHNDKIMVYDGEINLIR